MSLETETKVQEHSVATLLATYGQKAGLSQELQPFSEGATFAERLARNPYLMAPMAGVSDAAWRIMARAGGAGLAYTEMVSVAGIHYGGEKTWSLVLPDEVEPDIAVQLFGSKPEQFSEAATLISERLGERLALIDINMACPVPKVTRKGEGSALLDDPERACEIVRAVAHHTNVPVTAKIRIGRTSERMVGPEFAKRLEDAGVAVLAVHGRYASQLYRGTSDVALVDKVARAVEIPVIGSGDVFSPQDAVRMVKETACTAAFIARGTYGNPWIFADAQNLACTGQSTLHTPAQRVHALELHLRLLAATNAHLVRGRSIAAWYLKGMEGARHWREKAMACVSLDDFLELLASIRKQLGLA